ncbi:MAG TPA: MBL fold metallo-hydrolase [Burkholderiales bacterium]|nr:MBL fold metallo-hydrolase [Burkholderiales bacterium]
MKLALVFLAMLFGMSAAAQSDRFDKVEIKTTRLTQNLYLLEGEGGNIGVSAGDDGVFVIDDQFAPLTARIFAAIKAISDKPVRFLINTHWHFDHTGGNENFGKAGAVIVAQDNVKKRLATKTAIEFFKSAYGPTAAAGLPVITFKDTVTFHLNGDEATAIHVPNAHTDGDSIIHFRAGNVVHMGDTYFNGLYPFIDTGTKGSVKGMIAAADRALAITDDTSKIIPGHGPLSNKAELKAYRDMLAKVYANVDAMVKARKTLAQVIAARPTKDYDAKWGNGFLKPDQFAEIVYASAVKNR